MGWNHRSALGFLGFLLTWLVFFGIIGYANAKTQPPGSLAQAVGFGARDFAEFLWHAAEAAL